MCNFVSSDIMTREMTPLEKKRFVSVLSLLWHFYRLASAAACLNCLNLVLNQVTFTHLGAYINAQLHNTRIVKYHRAQDGCFTFRSFCNESSIAAFQLRFRPYMMLASLLLALQPKIMYMYLNAVSLGHHI